MNQFVIRREVEEEEKIVTTIKLQDKFEGDSDSDTDSDSDFWNFAFFYNKKD